MPSPLSTIPENQRIALLKSGMRTFLTNVRLPLAPDTRWLIEAVCLNYTPLELPENSEILDKANHYLLERLQGIEDKLNSDKLAWVQSMKN